MFKPITTYIATALAASPFVANAESDVISCYEQEQDVVQQTKTHSNVAKSVAFRMKRPDIFGDRVKVGTTAIPIVNTPDIIIDNRTVLIDKWNVAVPFSTTLANDLREKIVHDFMILVNKAEHNLLSESDADQYDAILDDVDYGLYCELNAPFVYKAARLLKKNKKSVVIRWNDSDSGVEHIRGALADCFRSILEGEMFSAEVRFERGRLVAATQVTPIEEYTG